MKVGTNNDIIYQGSEEKRIQLCYSHSVELYKNGQSKFMKKYRENFTEMEFDSAIFSPASTRNRSVWY